MSAMKNIQIIDGAKNCVYDIFSATDAEFKMLFPDGTDIAFIDDIYANGNRKELDLTFNNIWLRRVRKREIQGLHGTIFYELDEKKAYYPSRRDEEAVNPSGSRLR
jgi:hypothetical protein